MQPKDSLTSIQKKKNTLKTPSTSRSQLSLVQNNNNVTRMHTSAINKFKFTILNWKIRDIFITIHRLKKDFQFTQWKIKQTLPAHIY